MSRLCTACGATHTWRWANDRFGTFLCDHWCASCYRAWLRRRARCEACARPSVNLCVVGDPPSRVCRACSAHAPDLTRCARCGAHCARLARSPLYPGDAWCGACCDAYAQLYTMSDAQFDAL